MLESYRHVEPPTEPKREVIDVLNDILENAYYTDIVSTPLENVSSYSKDGFFLNLKENEEKNLVSSTLLIDWERMGYPSYLAEIDDREQVQGRSLQTDSYGLHISINKDTGHIDSLRRFANFPDNTLPTGDELYNLISQYEKKLEVKYHQEINGDGWIENNPNYLNFDENFLFGLESEVAIHLP